MSYQRPDGKGRHYIWMGTDGLHVMHEPMLLLDLKITHDSAGRDNAKALLHGLFDYMAAEGYTIKVRHGQPVFEKSK